MNSYWLWILFFSYIHECYILSTCMCILLVFRQKKSTFLGILLEQEKKICKYRQKLAALKKKILFGLCRSFKYNNAEASNLSVLRTKNLEDIDWLHWHCFFLLEFMQQNSGLTLYMRFQSCPYANSLLWCFPSDDIIQPKEKIQPIFISSTRLSSVVAQVVVLFLQYAWQLWINLV